MKYDPDRCHSCTVYAGTVVTQVQQYSLLPSHVHAGVAGLMYHEWQLCTAWQLHSAVGRVLESVALRCFQQCGVLSCIGILVDLHTLAARCPLHPDLCPCHCKPALRLCMLSAAVLPLGSRAVIVCILTCLASQVLSEVCTLAALCRATALA